MGDTAIVNPDQAPRSWGPIPDSRRRLPAARDLPAVKWRQLNLDKLTEDKRSALVAQLEEVLGGQATYGPPGMRDVRQ